MLVPQSRTSAESDKPSDNTIGSSQRAKNKAVDPRLTIDDSQEFAHTHTITNSRNCNLSRFDAQLRPRLRAFSTLHHTLISSTFRFPSSLASRGCLPRASHSLDSLVLDDTLSTSV